MNTSRSAGARSYVAGSRRTNVTRTAANRLAAFSSTAAATSTFGFMACVPRLVPEFILRREATQDLAPTCAGGHQILSLRLRINFQNRPAARSFGGSTSRQVVHQ